MDRGCWYTMEPANFSIEDQEKFSCLARLPSPVAAVMTTQFCCQKHIH